MSAPLPGLRTFVRPDAVVRVEHLHPSTALARLLAFAGETVDSVVNCPMAKRRVAHYFKVAGQMRRRNEVAELEAQWNPLGRR